MSTVFKNQQVKIVAIFKSKFGNHIVLNDFDQETILKKSVSDLSPLDYDIMELKREDTLEALKMFDEEEYFQSILSKKLIRKLINQEPNHIETIENGILNNSQNDITVIFVIDLIDNYYEFFEVVIGNRTAYIFENVGNWINCSDWEDGLDSLLQLVNYLNCLHELSTNWLSHFSPKD